VAVALSRSPQEGLAMLEPLDADDRIAGHHRLAAVRGHLLELAGDTDAAAAEYRAAARRTTSVPEQRYLDGRAASLERR
jgi:predicted RNA polymerase sigma factor